jgi:hypothetical protein
MFLAAVIVGGCVLGFVVGRWWALAGPVVLGIYLYVTAEASRFGHSDIPWSVVALVYAVWAAIGVIDGLVARRLIRRRPEISN